MYVYSNILFIFLFLLQYWPQPLAWNPHRFGLEGQEHINWHAYMPFGIGPRNCIGIRLGLLQTKLGLIHVLKNHRIVECQQKSAEVEFDPRTPSLSVKDGVHIRLEYAGEAT